MGPENIQYKDAHRNNPQRKYVFGYFHNFLSYEVSIFIFSTPCSSYTVCSSSSGAIFFRLWAIKCYIGVRIAYKIITPSIFMTNSPAYSFLIHDMSEIIIFYLSVLIDDTPCAADWYFWTSFCCFSEYSFSECPFECFRRAKSEFNPFCRISCSISDEYLFGSQSYEISIIEEPC